MTTRPAPQPTAVYRAYDAAGQLLYVGSTIDPKRRMGEHRRKAPWWSEVVRIEVVWYDFRQQGYDQEQIACLRERPLHNTHLVPGRKRRTLIYRPASWRRRFWVRPMNVCARCANGYCCKRSPRIAA